MLFLPLCELAFNRYAHGIVYGELMKYASIFGTILLIWIAIILMAITRSSASQIFELYIAAIVATLALFLIGFVNRR